PLDSPPNELVKRGERALSLGDAIVQRHGLPPPRRRLIGGRTIAGSILSTAEELNADLIVVANRGAADGSTSSSEVVDELLRRAPGKILVDRAGL
ncbi:MAG TPA: universal stress protein, partial [Dehalococcoidia bacterium]|nr:universal stress protein [Dehalococcoidia bacterium]